MRMDVLAQSGVNAALVALARILEKLQDIGIETQGNLLFVFCGNKRIWSCLLHSSGLTREIAVIDLVIRHGSDALQPLALLRGQRRPRPPSGLRVAGRFP